MGGGGLAATCGEVCFGQFCCENYVDGGQCTWDGGMSICNGDVSLCSDINFSDPCDNAAACSWNGTSCEDIGGGGPPMCSDLCFDPDPGVYETCCTTDLANPPCAWVIDTCEGMLMTGCADILDSTICTESTGGMCFWDQGTCLDVPIP